MALVFWLARNHTDPVSVGMLRVALAVIVIGIVMRAVSYRDEVQRQTSQKRWFWGSMIGLVAMTPAVVSLQTHKALAGCGGAVLFSSSRHWCQLYFSLGRCDSP